MITSLVLIIVCICGVTKVVSPMLMYNKALTYINEENYEDAIAIFETLNDYKDSKQKLQECKYNNAKSIIENGISEKLSDAIQYLSELETTDEIVFLIENGNFQLAEIDYAENRYSSALERLDMLKEAPDVIKLRIKCLWELIKSSYESERYGDVILYFDMLGDIGLLESDIDKAYDILNSSRLLYARECYEEGLFSVAILYYEKINELDEEDIKKYNHACVLNKLQGKWLLEEQFQGYEFIGWDAVYYQGLTDFMGNLTNPEITNKKDFLKNWIYEGGNIISYRGMEIDVQSSQTMHWCSDYGILIYNRVSKFHDEIEEPEEPRIGMTAEEVLKSTWGEPEHINKTTYSWGVKEQWCYSAYRYIYLENGIVTSISE